MAIKNDVAVYINGINLTAYTVMPLKWGNFLDERLDEMHISLRHCPISTFSPLSPVEIHFKNTLYYGNKIVDDQTDIKRYIVANDTEAEEKPIGSGFYEHNLYVIELTKYLECVIVDTNTFTNDLSKVYADKTVPIEPIVENPMSAFDPVTPISYVTPLPVGEFYFVSAHTVFPYESEPHPGGGNSSYVNTYEQTVYLGNVVLYTNIYKIEHPMSSVPIITGKDEGININLTSGQYRVIYKYTVEVFYAGHTGKSVATATYDFKVVDNRFPNKRWTITDVIKKLCEIAEPIRLGEKPRFRLNGIDENGKIVKGSEAESYEKIIAPQFSFTKSTFRECLQQCGAVLHGEPRIDIAQDSDGTYFYEIFFDKYGQSEKSGISVLPYIQKSVSQVLDSYATNLDTNAENLVNQLDKYAGVIVEPYQEGFKTVRTETMYTRITDANMIIPTQFPIYSIEKLECAFFNGKSTSLTIADITPYVFENTIYASQLSSYKDNVPFAKAYAIYYTQGQKNIEGLNFKQADAISAAVFKNYAIVNILQQATGKSVSITNYPMLAFRVTYTPFYSARVGQTKTNYKDYPYGAALIYNQQSNVVESRYYGENLKGTIARIGNVEKTLTYTLARLAEIPKAGQLFDDDYYISAVSVEYLPTIIRCTIGLSKDFNRLSQYIGISSMKRFSEISQGQAIERETLWKEYIVVGDEEETESCYIGSDFLQSIAETFTQQSNITPVTSVVAWGGSYANPTFATDSVVQNITLQFDAEQNQTLTISCKGLKNRDVTLLIYNGTENKTINIVPKDDSYAYVVSFFGTAATLISATSTRSALPAAALPVISSAFGNSISFSWEYEDNYSAGAVSQYAESGGASNKVTGYFQNNYQYPDYYGRMYYYNFDLMQNGEEVTDSNIAEIGCALPGVRIPPRESNIATTGHIVPKPIILRKDNREKLQCNFQVDFVSNRKNLIIGSALASYNPLVRISNPQYQAKLYVFNEPLNKFINHLESGLERIDLSILQGQDIVVDYSSQRVTVDSAVFNKSGKSWAIVMGQETKFEDVEDEYGNISKQKVQYGGDVLLAMNMPVTQGQAFTPIVFTRKRKIFKEDVWTNIK